MGLIFKASSFVPHKTRQHSKRILIKGYSTPPVFLWIKSYKLKLWNNILEAFSTSYKVFKHSSVEFGALSSAYAVCLKSSTALIGRFKPNNTQWLYTIFYFGNFVWKLLPWTTCTSKIKTCVKYSIDAYHIYILPRYISLRCFGSLNSRDCQGDC